jgi:dTDP-4-dehydrorhamnose reductase
MKVVVTGAGGQLGRALLETLPQSVHMVGLSRTELDITDRRAVASMLDRERPEWVLNAAAFTAVDQAESDEAAARAGNATGPAILAEEATGWGIRLAHVSTDFVFDGASGNPYIPESTPAPLGVYGRTKLEGELLVAHRAPGALIIRTSWVYSPFGRNFVLTMLRLMAERTLVRVVQDQVGSPTAADSLAVCLWSLVDRGAQGLYHVADSGVASWYDFAVAIREEALERGLLARPAEIIPISTIEYPTPARRPAYSVLDCSKTWQTLGHMAPHWRVSLRRTMDRIERT